MEDIPVSLTEEKKATSRRVLRRKTWGILALLPIILLSYGLVNLLNESVIAPNTFIEDIDVSNLTVSEAKQKYIHHWEKQKSIKNLQFKSSYLNKKISSISPKECGIVLDSKILEQIDFPTLNLLDKIKIKLNLYPLERTMIPPPLVYSSSEKNKLKDIVKGLVVHSTPARVLYKKGNIVYQSEGINYELDEESEILNESLINAYITKKMALLPIRMAKKHVSDESLHTIKDVISEFSTKFRTYQKDRNYNLGLASKIWNGLIILPNERVSFNKVVGTRTAEKGFRLATVFNKGKLDKGIGGGICQVSTTLYNALILANLKIIDRSNHSRPVSYVPIGRDAAVVYDGVDLVFENNQKRPIAISSECSENVLTFRILGSAVPNQKIEITETVLDKQTLGTVFQNDKTIPKGETKVLDAGALRAKVQSYRTVYMGETKVEHKPLHYSFYRGSPKIILKGSGPEVKKAVPAITNVQVENSETGSL